MTGKQRLLKAYRGVPGDRVAIAPELWYYYPAKILGVDMIEFQREVPFHQALKTAFAHVGCDGWGVTFASAPAPGVEATSREKWIDHETLEVRTVTKTPQGQLTTAGRLSRAEPGWTVERAIKDPERDLPAYEHLTLAGDPRDLNVDGMIRARDEVGEAYLLEAWLGVPFFDWYAGAREGGLAQGIYDLCDMEARLEALQEKYVDHMVRRTAVICERTPFESLCIGCSWSCNSLIGPALWRRWDKPVIQAVCNEAHRHGRLLHVHFHGKCMETVADFAEIGVDCVCPFERPPGGDVEGLEGLREAARRLAGQTTMNGNVHTVETLIRGTPEDVRREVREVLEAFAGNPRVIVGTGDQVGRETPEENLHAMIEEAKALSPAWLQTLADAPA